MSLLAKGVGDGQLPRARRGDRLVRRPPNTPPVMDVNGLGSSRTKILFVCLGNICRSPLAEGVFRQRVDEAGLSDDFEIDSAGTGSWHVGEPPDSRATMVAKEHGVDLDSRARQVTPEDLERFDHVIAMDRDNLRSLEQMAASSGGSAEIQLLRDYDPDRDGADVPDPYYGGVSGFENVYDIVSRSCEGLLAKLRALR